MAGLDYLKITITPAANGYGPMLLRAKTSMDGKEYFYDQPVDWQKPTESELDYFFRLARLNLSRLLEENE